MFFDGSLEAGIAKAVQESKPVVCFVSDDGDTSKLWQDVWLQDHNFPTLLPARSIALKLQAGSEQASFLAAVCPITTTPFLAVINQGKVEQTLTSSATKNDFTLRLLSALNMFRNPTAQASRPNPVVQSSPQATSAGLPSTTNTSTASQTPSTSNQPATSIDQTEVISERRARVEAQQAQVQAKTKAEADKVKERARIRKQEAQAAADTVGGSVNRPPAQQSYAEEQVKRKQQAQTERQRILKQIEYDKQERKQREEQRRASAAGTVEELKADTSYSRAAPSPSTSFTARIQARLLDGSTIRESFPVESKVAAIRTWLDSNRSDGDHPYTLKQLLTPLPSRTIEASDEARTIRELGLLPSATLILVPVQGLAAAYQQGTGSFIGTLFDTMWAKIVGYLLAAIALAKVFLGIGVVPPSATQASEGETSTASASSAANPGPTTSASGLRIRTLRDQRMEKEKDKGQQQLYNGNQLNFEPNKKPGDLPEEVAKDS